MYTSDEVTLKISSIFLVWELVKLHVYPKSLASLTWTEILTRSTVLSCSQHLKQVCTTESSVLFVGRCCPRDDMASHVAVPVLFQYYCCWCCCYYYYYPSLWLLLMLLLLMLLLLLLLHRRCNEWLRPSLINPLTAKGNLTKPRKLLNPELSHEI